MRIEFVDEAESQDSTLIFPPEENYVDLRENPRTIEQIAPARRYLPLRNFLNVVNGEESLFATFGAKTKMDLPAAVSGGDVYEFASHVILVFAELSLNCEREHFVNLRSGLNEHLERNSGDAVRAVLRISSCDFPAQNRGGFCLGIGLVAQGDSAEQVELRWGLGLARVQKSLLFWARSLKQKIGE